MKLYLIECVEKIGAIMQNDRDPGYFNRDIFWLVQFYPSNNFFFTRVFFLRKYFDWIIDKLSVVTSENREGLRDNAVKMLLLDALQHVNF